MNKTTAIIARILQSIIFIGACTLSMLWYDWKIIIIIFLFIWVNNVETKIQKEKDKEKS